MNVPSVGKNLESKLSNLCELWAIKILLRFSM